MDVSGGGKYAAETGWIVMTSELTVAKNSLSSILGLGKWPAAALDCWLKIYMVGTLPYSSSVNYMAEATQKAFETECKQAVNCRMEQCFACCLKMLGKGR